MGEIAWPAPQRLPIGPMVNYGYEGDVLLASPLSLDRALDGKTLAISLKAEWLVCKEVCIPESGSFTVQLAPNAVVTEHAGLFDLAHRSEPTSLPSTVAARLNGSRLSAEIAGLPPAWRGKKLEAYPEDAAVFDHASPAETTWRDEWLLLQLPVSDQRAESPSQMSVVLRPEGAPRESPAVRVAMKLEGSWPPLAAPAVTATTLGGEQGVSTPSQGEAGGALIAVGLAFLGGVLLNLMPCVFPVLSLKVVGLTGHAAERHRLRAGGVAYAAGVVLSFVALAALLLGLRAGGAQLGWGFQLQSPEFVAALALLFTLIALNLLGVFEFRGGLPGTLGDLRAAHPAVDSFLTGVLAVAVASPCTAPFMGVALGAALTLPAWQALAVFASLGLGMAAPYLLMTWLPAMSRLLPRPGVWMQHFKISMAFPMFATVIWLLWVLGQQVGIDGVAAMLGVLLAVALLVWTLGATDFGPHSKWMARALSLIVCALTLAWALPSLHERDAVSPEPVVAAGSGWQPWSSQAVEQALADGRPVFVDFTAAWCVTCQFNKRGALSDAEVVADFRSRGVVLLRADWTRHDPAISRELARLGRSGVPVYLLLKPGSPQPRLLPEILSVAVVRDALAEL